MIETTENQLELVRQILKTHVPGAHCEAFGSRVNGTAKQNSDLDILIKAKKKLSIEEKGKLIESFQESSLPFFIDIVDWYSLSDTFKSLISTSPLLN